MARPIPNLHGFIGQRRALRGSLRILHGTKALGRVLAHILILGGSGVGKTMLAKALTLEFGVVLHVIIASKDIGAIEIAQMAARWSHGDFVFIDEIHALTQSAQELIYRIMIERLAPKIEEDTKTHRVTIAGEMQVPEVTIIAATDQPGKLQNAFRKRFPITVILQPYSQREMIEIVKLRAFEAQILLTPQAARLLAGACRGSPRVAGHRIEALRAYHTAPANSEISSGQVKRYLKANRISQNGLGALDQQYLNVLLARDDHSAALGELAAALQVDWLYIQREVEPWLLRLGLVRVDRLRVLTVEGVNYARGLQQ